MVFSRTQKPQPRKTSGRGALGERRWLLALGEGRGGGCWALGEGRGKGLLGPGGGEGRWLLALWQGRRRGQGGGCWPWGRPKSSY